MSLSVSALIHIHYIKNRSRFPQGNPELLTSTDQPVDFTLVHHKFKKKMKITPPKPFLSSMRFHGTPQIVSKIKTRRFLLAVTCLKKVHRTGVTHKGQLQSFRTLETNSKISSWFLFLLVKLDIS